jgi:hypothetical protein
MPRQSQREMDGWMDGWMDGNRSRRHDDEDEGEGEETNHLPQELKGGGKKGGPIDAFVKYSVA